MMIKHFDYLFEDFVQTTYGLVLESNLSPAELLKRSFRTGLFAKKFIKGEEFDFVNGEKHIIKKLLLKQGSDIEEILPVDYTDANKLDQELVRNLEITQQNRRFKVEIAYIDKNGEMKEVSLSKLSKTAEFGGGKGSGAGAAQTAIQESLAALYFSYVYNIKNGKIIEDKLSESELRKAENFIDVKPTIDEITNFDQENEDWKNTSISSANLLYEQFKSNNQFTVVRSNSDVAALYSIAKKLIKSDLGLSVKDDKWNPADVWMIKRGFKPRTKFDNISDLNSYVLDMYRNKEMVGVSLKKLSKAPKVEIKNEQPKKSDYMYNGFVASDTSKDVYLKTNMDFSFQFRTGNPYTNFTGELIGRSAKQGKIGYTNITGYVNGIAKRKSNFPDAKEFKKIADVFKKIKFRSEEEMIEKFKQSQYYESFSTLYSKHVKSDADEFLRFMFSKKKKDALQPVFSKYIGLLLIETMNSVSYKVSSDIISNFISYAKSEANFSSVYLKIY